VTVPHDSNASADGAQTNDVWRWRDRAAQWLAFPLGRYLDYGCGRGELIETVSASATEAHGVDVDDAKIAAASKRNASASFSVVGLDGLTAYCDAYFDTISIVEVIEHVPDERAALAELHRILKPGGRLLLTTPHRGLLTFLDVGNFKFVMPRLHRFLHVRILRDPTYFATRFERTEAIGLIGDISVSSGRKPWHRHYRLRDIAGHCPAGLTIERHGVYFPAMRAFMLVSAAIKVVTAGRLARIPWPFSALERRLSRISSTTGDQLVVLMQKTA